MVGDCRIPGHITGLYIFAVVNLLVLLNFSLVNAEVVVIDIESNTTVATFDDLQAQFGPNFPNEGLIGRLIYVNPHNACRPVDMPPTPTDYPWIALIAREHCEFAEKVFNVQKQTFSAAIVHNYDGNDSIMHMGADSKYGNSVTIPSVFVGYDDGMRLARFYDAAHRSILIKIIENGDQYDFGVYLWPMAIVVGCCFLLMIIFLIAKWVRGIMHRRRSRLSTRALKKIPIKKFKKGDHYDVCAICLDDYEEGEKLRVLPCNHAFHTKCVDPWLTKRKKTCPCCKRRVIPGHDDGDSDSDNENDSEAPDENTPLIGSSASNASRSSASAAAPPGGADPESGTAQGGFWVSVRRAGRRSRRRREQLGEASETAAAEAATPEEAEEGAVGGAGISDQACANYGAMDDQQPSTSNNATVSAELHAEQEPERSSPVRMEGSINTGFSSSEDDTAAGNGRGKGKKKKKSNQVV